jgi:hypothetical protein
MITFVSQCQQYRARCFVLIMKNITCTKWLFDIPPGITMLSFIASGNIAFEWRLPMYIYVLLCYHVNEKP